MTREDIIKMAREAGAIFDNMAEAAAVAPIFERFAALVAEHERNACVQILEAYQIPVGNSRSGELACEWTYDALKEIRDDIRARGNT